MEFTLEEMKADPNFVKASPTEQKQAELKYTQDAWTEQSKDLDYVGGTVATRQAFKEAFDFSHPMGKEVRAEEGSVNDSFAKNMGLQFGQGVHQTVDALRTADDVSALAFGTKSREQAQTEARGYGPEYMRSQGVPEERIAQIFPQQEVTPSDDLAARILASQERRRTATTPKELKEAEAFMAEASKKYAAADTVAEKLAAATGIAFGTVKEAVTNPKGAAYLSAQSGANMIPTLAGMVGGAVTAGPGGAAAGAFGASTAVEEGSYFLDKVAQEVTSRGMEMTEANIQKILADKDFVKETAKAAIRKGAATGATDAALGAVGGVVGAGKGIKASAKAAILELASEPVSEAAGQLAAEGKVDAGELAGEFLGGFGSTAVATPVQTAVYGGKKVAKHADEIGLAAGVAAGVGVGKVTKAAATKVKETAAKVVRKKSPEEEAAIKMSKAPTEHQYKEKVAEAVETGAEVDAEANPIMAAEVAQKVNQKEETPATEKVKNVDKVQKAYTQLEGKMDTLMAEIQGMPPKGERTAEQSNHRVSLMSQARAVAKTMETLDPILKSMSVEGADHKAGVEQARAALKSDDSGAVSKGILAIFGSRKGSQLADSTTLSNVLQNPKIDDSVKAQVKGIQAYRAAERELVEVQSGKHIQTVHSDVVEGGPGFKGSKNYLRDTAVAVQEGDLKLAQEQVEGLRDFAAIHTDKAEVFKLALDEVISSGSITPETQARLEVYNQKRINQGAKTGYTITPSSGKLVSLIAREAETLNRAVVAAESFLPTTPTAAEQAVIDSESGTTERTIEGDVATAETPDVVVEGSVRPESMPATAADEESTQTTTKEVRDEKEDASEGQREEDEADSTEGTEVREDRKDSGEEVDQEPQKTEKGKTDGETRSEDKEVHASPVATVITTPVDTDPGNRIKNNFEPKKELKGILHTTEDAMADFAPESLADAFTEKQPLDEHAEVAIHAIKEFSTQFNEAFDKTFNPEKTADYRFEDPITFLLNDDKTMPANVVNAIMAASYKWVAARGEESIVNYEDDIISLMGLEDDHPINRKAHELLGQIGLVDTLLQESLGAEIYQLLGIKETGKADHNAKNKLELSLGMQAIATMQTMGLLEQTDILRGAAPGQEKGSTKGFIGLVNMQSDADQDKYQGIEKNFIRDPEDYTQIKGEGFMTFYRLKAQGTAVEAHINESFIVPYKNSKHAWDRVFKGESNKRTYSFEPHEREDGPATYKGTDFQASKKQTDNLRRHEARPYKTSPRSMGMYLLMDDDNLKKLQGWKDPKLAHISNKDSVEGVNLGITRTNEAVHQFLTEAARQPDGYASEFYLSEEFWRQGRMGQVGEINPQGDKTHRFLFNMSTWEREFDLSDIDLNDQFMEAVALGMDIEVSKEGGLQQALTKTRELLSTPVMQEAITAIQEIFDGQGPMDTLNVEELMKTKGFYKKEMDAITKASMKGGMGIHSMKALIEYARYLSAIANGETKFKTDLATEIDGVSNGPTIGRIQLMTNNADMGQTLTALQNAGFAFSEAQPGLAEHLASPLAHDAYQSTGFAWTGALIDLERELVDAISKASGNEKAALRDQYTKAMAIKEFFGEFRDPKTGNISKVVRKLSKDPTMRTVYGMGSKALLKELQNTFTDKFVDQVEKLVADNDVDGLRAFARNMKDITGRNVFDAQSVVDGKINTEHVLKTELNKQDIEAVSKNLTDFHGAALGTAIESVFGEMQAAFTPLNTGVGLSAVAYNTVRKLKIQQAQALATAENREITVAEFKAIDKSIKKMFPHVVTRHGAKIPLAKMSKEKQYSDKATGLVNQEVKQKYKKESGLRGKKAAPFKKMGVDSPGVAPTILSIHNTDSMVANNLMGIFDILNNHDGFTIGVGMAKELGQKANEAFYDTMYNFDLGAELHKATAGVLAELKNQMIELKAAGFTQAQINEAMAAEFHAQGTRKIPGPEGKKVALTAANYGQYIKDTMADMDRVAKETAANKKKVLDATVKVEQYSYPDGEYRPGNKAQYIQHGDKKYDPHSVTAEAENRLNDAMKASTAVARDIGRVAQQEGLVKAEETFNNTSYVELSIDPADYAMAEEVDAMNLTDVYDRIKDDSTVVDSVEHAEHLKGILEGIVKNVMSPVELFLKEDPNAQPEGAFVHLGSATDRVFISSQNQIIGPVSGALSQGIRMSTGEVYTHEMLHHVLHTGMNINSGLRQKVDHLHRMAKKHLGADGYKVFLNDPTIDVTDPAHRFEVQAAKDRYDYIFANLATTKSTQFAGGVDPATGIQRVQEKSNQLDEFIVLGLTNENFMKALDGIELTGSGYNKGVWKGFWAKSIQGMLSTILEAAYDIIHNGFISRTATGTMSKELETLAKLLASKQAERKGALFAALQKAGVASSKVSQYSNEFIKNTVGSAPVIRAVNELREQATRVRESDTVVGQWLREREYAYQRLEQGFIKSTITEMRGRTDRMAWLYQLLSRRQVFLDQAKESEADTTIKMCNDLFKDRPLESSEKTAVTKVGLKTDASVLLRSLGMNRLRAILGNERSLNSEISRINQEIAQDADLAPYATYFRRASDALGHFMVHSRARSGEVVLQNAWLIASLSNTQKAADLDANQIEKAEALVDQLASLYALKYTSGKHRAAFRRLCAEQPEGVTGVLSLHEVLKDRGLEHSFNGNKAKFIKGYTKQILNPRISFLYGTLQDEAEMKAKGYVRQGRAVQRDSDDPTNDTAFYVYTSRTGRSNDLASSIFSFTGNKARGTNSERIAAQMDESTSVGKMNNQAIIRAKERTIDRMMDPNFTPGLEDGNFMIPKVDDQGNITGYRYMMAEATKDDFMEQVTEFDKIMGSMAGQVVDKSRTPIINQELVHGLYAVYQDGYDDNPGGFVEIGPASSDERLRELYYMMPPAAKKVMNDTFGQNRMFVPKDMVDISFGYRHYGVMESFVKSPADRNMVEKMVVGTAKALFGDKAAQRMSTIEHVAMEMTKYAKSSIIVRSLHVTLGNLGSNMVYLKSKGVPLSRIVKLSYEAWSWGNKYQEDKSTLDQAELQKSINQKQGVSSKQLDLDIIRLKDAIARNPTTLTIQAGLMPSLVDDVETVTGGSNFPTPMEKRIEALGDKLPSLVQTVGKNVLLTEDSKTFKVLNNAVKMTDFIGRHVLYNHYTQGGMSHEEAVAKVEDEFINFNVPTHRMVEYGNQIGLLWFTKYATRILKVVKDSVVDRPFDVFMAYMWSVHSGMDNIINSVPTGIDGIVDNMGNPFTNLKNSLDEPIFINAAEELMK